MTSCQPSPASSLLDLVVDVALKTPNEDWRLIAAPSDHVFVYERAGQQVRVHNFGRLWVAQVFDDGAVVGRDIATGETRHLALLAAENYLARHEYIA